MNRKSKRAVSALVATVLMILITVAAVGIIWGAIMPMLNKATQLGQACTSARLMIDTTRGYTCYDTWKKQASIMIARGAEDFELAGMQIGLASEGEVKSYEIKQGEPPVLYLPFDGSPTDASPSNHVITLEGTAQLDTTEKKFGTGSLLLDGDSDYLSIPDLEDWDVVGSASDDWTIDLWVKSLDNSVSISFIGQIEDWDNYWLFYQTVAVGLGFQVKADASLVLNLVGGSLPDNDWHHLALSKVGSTYGIYLDGTQVSYGAISATDTMAARLAVGAYYHEGLSTSDQYLNGSIDELRIAHSNVFGAAPDAGNSDTITVLTSTGKQFFLCRTPKHKWSKNLQVKFRRNNRSNSCSCCKGWNN